MKNKIIDLFCGCGGLSKGFEKAGFEVVLAIDFWKDAVLTFNHNHKQKVAQCCDIKDITDDMLIALNQEHDIVGVIGGPPCQGFSTVGKREKDDPRNTLYQEYCRVVKTINPEFFVLENVKGLLTLDNGSYKKSIIDTFSNLGYNVSFKVLNAANFGVPQKRERVFFVGFKNKNFTFPQESYDFISTSDALSDLGVPIDGLDLPSIYRTLPTNDYQRYIRNNQNEVLNHNTTLHSQATIDTINLIPDGGSIKDLPDEYWQIRKYNKAFQRMNSGLPSNTIDTGHRNYFHYKENRIPTARESARIQSFQDDFVFCGSKTSQYKQIGNAVPPLLAFAVAKKIKKLLEEK
ncbi:MAG: DNA cytosine methyltransferase [Clostridia bacterium]|nr:DNA cytosine methyltransferase [Clostridia bacterium]